MENYGKAHDQKQIGSSTLEKKKRGNQSSAKLRVWEDLTCPKLKRSGREWRAEKKAFGEKGTEAKELG